MHKSILYAVMAVARYALNAPVSKLLLQNVPATMMAGFLYLGAGIGMAVMGLVRNKTGHGKQEMRLTKKDLPYTLGMVILDIAAPIFLMIGLTRTAAANASLLNNFEHSSNQFNVYMKRLNRGSPGHRIQSAYSS